MNINILCKNCAISLSSQISVPSSPTPHLHRTCQVPNASETKSLQEVLLQVGSDLARLDSEIDQVQGALEALRQKREALFRFTVEHNAILAPIRRLPLELLTDIFARCSPPSTLWQEQEAPLLCAQICASWRKAALATEQLWSSIHVSYHGCLNMSLFETWLSRANSCALLVSIVCRQGRNVNAERWQRFSSLIDLVVGHCDRWKVVLLRLPSSKIYQLGESVRHRLSRLEVLHISNSDNMSPWPELDAFESAPRLHNVGLDLSVSAQRLRIPWNQIRGLVFTIRDVTECLESLQMMSNHRLLSLGCTGTLMRGERHIVSRRFPTIRLPYLKNLEIRGIQHPNSLFDHLELPVLYTIRALKIRPSPAEGLWLSQQPFLSLLSRCSGTLRKLVITDAHTPSGDIPDLSLVLQAIPLLAELVIQRASGWLSANVLNRLTRCKDAEVELAPRLKVLDIVETYTSLSLPLFADMIISRWRVDKDCPHPVEKINSVRLLLCDPPNGDHQGYHPDPNVLKRLSDCRVEGMDITATYASCHIPGIRDLLNASEQSTARGDV